MRQYHLSIATVVLSVADAETISSLCEALRYSKHSVNRPELESLALVPLTEIRHASRSYPSSCGKQRVCLSLSLSQ